MVLCTNCIKEGAEACLHPVHAMEGLDMVPYAVQKTHQLQKWVQMSEDERRDRREQQRLWYRRRRAQMSDQEIAELNERRRMRYRMRRLQANAEQGEGSTPMNPMPGLHEASALVNGQQVTRAAEIEKDHQRSILGWRALMNGHRTELQEQQWLSKGQQCGQVRSEQLWENEGQQRHWRWKAEARKGSADAEAQSSHSNPRIQYASRGVDGQSDDSETTETDDSWRGMILSRYSGALVIANEPASVHYLACADEVTSKAPPFEGTSQVLHQHVARRAGFLPNQARLTEIKRLARGLHFLWAS